MGERVPSSQKEEVARICSILRHYDPATLEGLQAAQVLFIPPAQEICSNSDSAEIQSTTSETSQGCSDSLALLSKTSGEEVITSCV